MESIPNFGRMLYAAIQSFILPGAPAYFSPRVPGGAPATDRPFISSWLISQDFGLDSLARSYESPGASYWLSAWSKNANEAESLSSALCEEMDRFPPGKYCLRLLDELARRQTWGASSPTSALADVHQLALDWRGVDNNGALQLLTRTRAVLGQIEEALPDVELDDALPLTADLEDIFQGSGAVGFSIEWQRGKDSPFAVLYESGVYERLIEARILRTS